MIEITDNQFIKNANFLQKDFGIKIFGDVYLSKGVKICPNVTIGCYPEHLFNGAKGIVFIGKNTTIRENTVISRGTTNSGTIIGSNCYIMNGSYIAHDTKIGDNVIISSGVRIGGHCRIQSYSNLGMNSCFHQFTCVGTGAMVGMGAVVIKHVLPFQKVVGNPAKSIGSNGDYIRKKYQLPFTNEEYYEIFDSVKSKKRA